MTGFEWYWSWILSPVSLIAFWQVGNRHRWAFLLMTVGELLWVGWAVLTHQWGFIPASVIWAGIAFRNWVRWHPLAKHPPQCSNNPRTADGDSGVFVVDNESSASSTWCGEDVKL